MGVSDIQMLYPYVKNDGYRALSDRLGSLHYMGGCPRCYRQYMSGHEMVLADRTCARCADRLIAARHS